MKPMPNLDDVEAMAARGRRSALSAARKEALEELRDAFVSVQSVDFANMHADADRIIAAANRLLSISSEWERQ